MPTKQVSELNETSTPSSDDVTLIENSIGVTFKTKIGNLLKRLFSFDDVYDDYVVSGVNLTLGGGNAAPSFQNLRNNLWTHTFDNGAQIQEGFFIIHILHDIKPNTDMTFHVHWTHNEVTPVGNMKWNVEYALAKGYEIGDFTNEIVLSTVQTAGLQYAHHITDDDDMVVVGINGEIEPDTVILGRIFRDPTDIEDTFTGDAFLLQVDLHYIKSRVGTTERNAPFTSGGF